MDDYERLGLKSGASKEAIQTAYKVKLLRFQQLGSDKSEEDKAEFKEIDEAYNRLCGYDIKVEEEPHSKIKDFFYYNKEMIFVILFVVFIFTVFITQISNKTEYDINVAIIGNITNKSDEFVGSNEMTSIGNIIKEKIYGINEPLVDFYQRSLVLQKNQQDQYYNTVQQKLVTRLQTGELDLLIMDEENYEDFCEKRYLQKLDDYIINYSTEKIIPDSYKVEGYGEDKEGTYGISLKGTRYIESLELKYNGDLIACICVSSDRKEIAFSIIEQLTLKFKDIV